MVTLVYTPAEENLYADCAKQAYLCYLPLLALRQITPQYIMFSSRRVDNELALTTTAASSGRLRNEGRTLLSKSFFGLESTLEFFQA